MKQETELNLSKQEDATIIQETNQTKSSNNLPEKQKMFSNPFSFSGRIRRLEYGLTYIIYMVWYIIFNIGIQISVNSGNNTMSILLLGTLIPVAWFMWAQGAKRCHDRDNSGWYQLIPFYGLWMLFGDGDDYENSYGPDPKGRDSLAEFRDL